MDEDRMLTKMPELPVFTRALVFGFLVAEIFRITYIGGSGLVAQLDRFDPCLRLAAASSVLATLIWYAVSRELLGKLNQFRRSRRVDLLLSAVLGFLANNILSSFLQPFHERVAKVDSLWTVLLAAFLLLMVVSSLIRAWLTPDKNDAHQLYFLTDDEIRNSIDDVLANQDQATHFAQTVLESGSDSGLVYGIDGPWGTGKTSFVNLASNYWKLHANSEVIVFRFEPLRYASDPDLAERFLRDLSAEIRRQVFAPEFRTATTRYSRMLKGKANFSFLGFKLEIEPSVETIDDLLRDIDDVLKRIRRRLIVVIDDLDRLDAKAVNNVLFTVRRTFRLTQAAYILCYDTENLVADKEDGERARQFLEKFVNIKLSLFVDRSALIRFLRWDWKKEGKKYQAVPSETMLKLESILSELANILEDDEHTAVYMLLIGDMRKLKRFVNAMLLMRIEKTDLARTDFYGRDLVNLLLLHLNYPGTFRRIYVEETDGRSGVFSIKAKTVAGGRAYVNDERFEKIIKSCLGADQFLLEQLFSSNSLGLDAYGSVEESVLASRACFNTEPHRNLEAYLKLIVKFSTPEPRKTFRLYQNAVGKVIGGMSIDSVLAEPEFSLSRGEVAHDQFWRILVSQSYELKGVAAGDSIDTLVKLLPKYSAVDVGDRGLRHRSTYTLIRLLDRAGWGRTDSKRLPNTPENVVEIAHRIYGEHKYSGRSLIEQLAAQDRGVLGLFDLLLFRLQCSADRQGQVYNLHTALIVHDDMNAKTTGHVTALAIAGMRTISQRIFSLFKSRYVAARRNLFDEIDAVSDTEFLGVAAEYHRAEAIKAGAEEKLRDLIDGARSMTKTFVVYQLANRKAGTGSGVGCGYYDVTGVDDDGEIARHINEYLFDVCFNPEISEKNVEHFLDYCLCNLTSGIWSGDDEDGYHPTPMGLANELSADMLADYWQKHGGAIRTSNFHLSAKRVVTLNYVATYETDLTRVFDVLDQIQFEKEKKQCIVALATAIAGVVPVARKHQPVNL